MQMNPVKLTVDCALSNSLLALAGESALARLLSKANVRLLDLPLEAVTCIQHGLAASPDYPIAPIAAHADGLAVGDAYWLRADPVHLLLQRDSFSMSEPVPMPVTHDHAELMIATLNRHFSQDGMRFFTGRSGAWYVRLDKVPQIQTTLPCAAMDRNIYPCMPQGADASAWVSYLNEIQMLLHDHPANMQRESGHQPVINSVWFSGGGVMPQQPAEHDIDRFVAGSQFYLGLAQWSGVAVQAVPPLAELLQHTGGSLHVRLELPGQHLSDDMNFAVIYDALNAGGIRQLTLNLGCYEKTLVAALRPVDTYKFWRSSQPIGTYFKSDSLK